MKFSEVDETIANLREMADWMDKNRDKVVKLPSLSLSTYISVYEYERTENGQRDYTKIDAFATHAKMRGIAKVLANGGNVAKDYSGTGFTLRKKFGKRYGSNITLTFATQREAVCRKVVKGTKIIPAKTIVQPERVEEEVEWVCTDSLLAPNE